MVLANVIARTRERLLAAELADGVSHDFFDAWFMDDGQVLLEPAAVDAFLAILDDELASVGASRGVGADVKSIARVVGTAEAVTECGDAWVTDRVRRTCKLPGPNAPVHVLGVDIGDAAVATSQFRDATTKTAAMREGIAGVCDAGVELVLT